MVLVNNIQHLPSPAHYSYYRPNECPPFTRAYVLETTDSLSWTESYNLLGGLYDGNWRYRAYVPLSFYSPAVRLTDAMAIHDTVTQTIDLINRGYWKPELE